MSEQEFWENRFRETEGKAPDNQWQLMQYTVTMETQRKQHNDFWKGVFGL